MRLQFGKWIGFGASVFIAMPIAAWLTGDILNLDGLTKLLADIGLTGAIGYTLWQRWFSKLG